MSCGITCHAGWRVCGIMPKAEARLELHIKECGLFTTRAHSVHNRSALFVFGWKEWHDDAVTGKRRGKRQLPACFRGERRQLTSPKLHAVEFR